MKNITLYLDMDGVLADFHKEYLKHDPDKSDRKKFRSAVMEHNIFEKLDFMPDTQELLNHVSKLQGVTIEILTSMGESAAAARVHRRGEGEGAPARAGAAGSAWVRTLTQFALPSG